MLNIKKDCVANIIAFIRLGCCGGNFNHKPKIFNCLERENNHTGIEKRPRSPRGAAVRNIGQWAQAWSSNIVRMKTKFVKFGNYGKWWYYIMISPG